MAKPRSWSDTIALVQKNQPLDQQHGFIQLVDGRVFYSPNCKRTLRSLPTILASDSDDLKQHVSHVQTPYWWNPSLAYLPFIPLDPQYTNTVPFQGLAFIPHQSISCPGGKMMPLGLQSEWNLLEKALIKATRTLLLKFNVQGVAPPLPSTLGYMAAHLLPRHLKDALTRCRESFSLWIGALAFAIALSDFMLPKGNDAIPAWYSALREAGLDEVWVDGLRTSPIMQFDDSTPRVGVLLDILSPKVIQASVDWLCSFNVPVWYPWGSPEAAAAVSNTDLAKLAPHPHQLQSVSSSFFSKEVGDTYRVAQHDFHSRSNKRPFEAVSDEVRISKRPRQDPHASNERDPWGGSSAITWTTNQSNPWGNGNWPVSSEPPSNHASTFDSNYASSSHLGQEQPIAPPRLNLTENVDSYEPFFARRKERNERILKSENAKEKQKRLNREKVRPKTKTFVFEWEKSDNKYTRVKLTRSQAEDTFGLYGKHQRRYDAFANEWDLCEDFGPLDKRQRAEGDEEFTVPDVAVSRDQATPSHSVHPSPTADLEMQATNSGSHIAHNMDPSPQTMDQVSTVIPETSAKNPVIDLPSKLTSPPDPDPPTLVETSRTISVAPILPVDRGASVSDILAQGPSPSIEEAASMFLEAPCATSVIPIPQVEQGTSVSDTEEAFLMSPVPTPRATSVLLISRVDPSVPSSGVACYEDVADVSQNEDEDDPPILSQFDSSVGNQGTSVSHTIVDTEGQLQSANEMEAQPSMSVVPTVPQVDLLVPCSGIEDQIDVSLDEGLAQIRRVPDSDFSWPISSSMTALVTASEKISGNGLQDDGLTETRLQASSDFSWPISSSLMALITASEDISENGIQPILTVETFNTTSILHSVFGFIYPNSASSQPAAASIDGPTKKKLQVSVGLDENEVEFLQSPLAHPALEFLNRLADAKCLPSAESSDLVGGSLRNVERLRQLRAVGNLYVFDFKTDATLPWMIGVATAAIALYIVRLDSRFNDYEISRHLLHRGIAFHTVLPLRKVPKSSIPPPIFSSIRSAGYIFTIEDFNVYIHRRDSLLRSPRGRTALLKGGIVWRLAVETIGVDECLEGPSIETIVHRRGLVHPTADPSVDLCDDDLSTDELDLICGGYECLTGKLLSLLIIASSLILYRNTKSKVPQIMVPTSQHLGSDCGPRFLVGP